MDNAQKSSVAKICTVLAFACTAIMTSVIVFHLNHKNDTPALANDNSIIFPAGRDITDFSLVTTKETVFTPKNLQQHWTLLFFGFTHCPNVCPTTLSMLGKAYQTLHEHYPDLQIVLVSLDPERDNIPSLAQYTANFNPNIIGVSGNIQELRKLQSQLGIFSERSIGDDAHYSLQHTASILLINPHGKWVGMFKFGLTTEAFITEFNANIKQLTKTA